MPPIKRKASTTSTTHGNRAKRRAKQAPPHSDDPSPRLEQLEPPTLLDVLDADRNYPIYEQLCSYMPIQADLALSSTCKQLRKVFLQRYSVDRRLLRFVKDPLRLRSELGRHGSLISGSFAIQLFAQRLWLESDLDVFVEEGEAAESFEVYLEREEDYRLKSTVRPTVITPQDQDTIETRTYRRPKGMDRTQAKVKLHVTRCMPVHAILATCYMSAMMNMISWNKAYSLFAKDTFLDLKTYMLKPVDDNCQRLLQKYAVRGWTLEEIVRPEDHCPKSSIQPIRRLGDGRTWAIALSTEGVDQASQPDLVMEASVFSLYPEKSDRTPGLAYYNVEVEVFQHLALNYRFVVSPDIEWAEHLTQRLDSYARLGLLAMPRETRPRWFAYDGTESHAMLQSMQFCDEKHIEEFKKPAHWKNFDHELPRWYTQWYSRLQPVELEFDYGLLGFW